MHEAHIVNTSSLQYNNSYGQLWWYNNKPPIVAPMCVGKNGMERENVLYMEGVEGANMDCVLNKIDIIRFMC